MARLLVIDDQDDIRALLKAVLEPQGHTVELAPSGTHALERFDDRPLPDLIVLDVQMPEMDGWETLSRVRADHGAFGPPVVLCTVKGHPRDLLRGWTLGCDGYVWKPFDLKLLVGEIEAVLARDESGRADVRRRAVGEAHLLLRAADA